VIFGSFEELDEKTQRRAAYFFISVAVSAVALVLVLGVLNIVAAGSLDWRELGSHEPVFSDATATLDGRTPDRELAVWTETTYRQTWDTQGREGEAYGGRLVVEPLDAAQVRVGLADVEGSFGASYGDDVCTVVVLEADDRVGILPCDRWERLGQPEALLQLGVRAPRVVGERLEVFRQGDRVLS